MLNKSLKVFSQLYVGFQKQVIQTDGWDSVTRSYKNPVYGTRLGFATPYEDNYAGRKRQQTVDKWANNSYRCEKEKAEIIDNVPVDGFKITDNVKRKYWGGGNVVFRVEDPRGFELEIQSQNLMMLLRETTIANGTIVGKCVWARDGGENILIHESSEEYKNARLEAEKIKPLATSGDSAPFKPGDQVLLTNGKKAWFIGRFWFYSYTESANHQCPDFHFSHDGNLLAAQLTTYTFNKPTRYFAVEVEGKLTLFRELKVERVVEAGAPLTPEEGLQVIDSHKNFHMAGNQNGTITTFAASLDKNEQPVWRREALSAAEIDEILQKMLDLNDRKTIFGPSVYVNRGNRSAPFELVFETAGHTYAFSAFSPRFSKNGVHAYSAFCLDTSGDTLIKYVPTASTRENMYPYVWTTMTKPPVKGLIHQRFSAPLFNMYSTGIESNETMITWFKDMAEQGALYKCVATLKDDPRLKPVSEPAF